MLSAASGLAANPFESALRALAIECVGPMFTPQVAVEVDGVELHPDLVCEDLKIAVEADSFEFHTSRVQLDHDCWRYNELTLAGWLVLRFTWVQLRHRAAWVRGTIQRAVESRQNYCSSFAW
ncbi:endonuclease domain-containing protein [Demetria terragena]|uniref:endonuclease domain-containing protein n=1 Tax=Demetria terragena TaxID=63959 RepID=UPI000367D0FD|nr:DUF559 domain-containing protein [Demetria terragena]